MVIKMPLPMQTVTPAQTNSDSHMMTLVHQLGAMMKHAIVLYVEYLSWCWGNRRSSDPGLMCAVCGPAASKIRESRLQYLQCVSNHWYYKERSRWENYCDQWMTHNMVKKNMERKKRNGKCSRGSAFRANWYIRNIFNSNFLDMLYRD